MFVLQLNDMRASNAENLTWVARAETKEKLQRFLENEKVEYYKDGRWGKTYRKGGPLEWCNPPFSSDDAFVDVKSADEWAANARQRFDDQVMGLPQAI
jgi:hypothetical protein